VKAEVPENGYMGNYMIDLAKEIIAEHGDKFQKLTEAEALKTTGRYRHRQGQRQD